MVLSHLSHRSAQPAAGSRGDACWAPWRDAQPSHSSCSSTPAAQHTADGYPAGYPAAAAHRMAPPAPAAQWARTPPRYAYDDD